MNFLTNHNPLPLKRFRIPDKRVYHSAFILLYAYSYDVEFGADTLSRRANQSL